MNHSLPQRTRGHWKSILSGVIGAEYFTGKHGPCPLCGGTDRFRFDNLHGTGTYYCNQCGAGNGIDLLSLHQKFTAGQAWMLVEELLPDAEDEPVTKPKDYSDLIKKLLAESRNPALTRCADVSEYLHNRGLTGTPAIRQCSYVDFSDPAKPTYQAMLCRAEKNKKLAGLHLTLLKDGKKADIPNPRRLLKVSDGALNGAAIHLYADVWAAMNSTLLEQVEVPKEHDQPLIIAEGIETALSAHQFFSHATSSIVIAGDNDAQYGGQAAAYRLAHRLCSKGHTVDVRIPTAVGTDWNDVLMKGGK